jgi:uncharacterized membrane protein
MERDRLVAFSDGVIAVIITIMVLELKAPHEASLGALQQAVPVFLSYVLSFVYVGIYWSNHHHMLYLVPRVSGGILWANLHLLFWLSLVPFTTSWLGEHYDAAVPAAVYGVSLLMPSVAWYGLQTLVVRTQGPDSALARALGRDVKGKISPVFYLAGILLAFIDARLAEAIYVVVAVIWVVPDRRFERALQE